jgi:hypothetical protein
VALIFSLLQFWLDSATNIDTAKATILQIEQTQFRIMDFVNHFKIASGCDILILFILIALAGAFPVLEQYKVKDKLKKYNKAIKSVLFFLTISTSFTFFGNRFASQEEGRMGELEIHKLQIFEGNKLLLRQINDAVTDKVVNEIIGNPDVEMTLDEMEEIKKNIEAAKDNDEYKNYIAVAPPNFIKNLSVATFENKVSHKYNFAGDFVVAENKFYNSYSQKAPSEPDFYKFKQESNYTEFKANNTQWYDEKSFSESSVKKAEETFSKARQSTKSKYARYYNRYKEPIEKLIKKGYRNTGSKWIKDFFEAAGIDFPFLDEFIDPIINEPIEDYITKKTETIFKACTENQGETVQSELKKCSAEFKETFGAKVDNSQKFTKLKNEVSEDYTNSKQVSALTETEIKTQMRNAETHFKTMCTKSRWEGIRISFSQRLKNPIGLDAFSSEQLDRFRHVLSKWENYKTEQKFNWYFNAINDIEREFFNYSRNNGDLKACWGYILQQQDWTGAANYYTNIHPDATATGKPYYLLKYYYNSIGEGALFESLYDEKTNAGVGEMCPH